VAEDAEEVEEGGGGGAGIRPFWSGTITFGLVNVPVNLFSATRTARVPLHMVTEEGTRLERHYFCSEDGEELSWDEIVRGYEIEKGKFVVVTDDELEAIEPRKSRDIDLRVFVDRNEIDPMLFERAYYLTPSGGSNKAYRLLAEVMESTGRAGIATFVMRTKEFLIAILAEKGVLRAETLRFPDEIRTPEFIGLPEKKKAAPADVKKFEKAIQSRVKKLDLREFLDPSADEIQKLAQKKQKKHEGVIRTQPEPERDQGGAEVIDILEVLQRSLRGEKVTPATGAKRTASKKKSATKKTASKKAAPARKPAKRAAKKGSAKKAARSSKS
jgi:DNA end-binding protein Ku